MDRLSKYAIAGGSHGKTPCGPAWVRDLGDWAAAAKQYTATASPATIPTERVLPCFRWVARRQICGWR